LRRFHPKKSRELLENLLKQLGILLGLAGYELIITNSAHGLIGYIIFISVHIRRVLEE